MKKNLIFESHNGKLDMNCQTLTRIYKTNKGIKVEHREVWEGSGYDAYYRDGNYPDFPNDWHGEYNENFSNFDYWIERLDIQYKPNKFNWVNR